MNPPTFGHPRAFRRVARAGSLACALACVLATAGAQTSARFTEAVRLGAATPNSVTVAPRAEGLAATFATVDWPNVTWRAPEGKPWDWSAADALVIELTSRAAKPLQVNTRMDETANSDGITHTLSSWATVPPGRPVTMVVPLSADEPTERFGMRGAPPLVTAGEVLKADTGGAADRSHIYAFQIFLHKPDAPVTLEIRSVRLALGGRALYAGIVDRFGQYTGATWPGKLRDAADLLKRRDTERADLAAHPAMPGTDEYGGWVAGPKVRATGYFRTEKRDGRWWLVTPSGHLFLSFGLNVMQPHDETVVEKREYMFAALPKDGDPLARHYGYQGFTFRGPVKAGRTFDFYGANLERKYGASYLEDWRRASFARMRSWGFDTVGNWSDPGLAALRKMPYVVTLGVGGDYATVPSGSDLWGQMPDVFDPRFAASAERSLAAQAAAHKSDPWCLGYFVDNELSWAGWDENGKYGLAYGALASPADKPAKRAFVERLKARYADIAKLNAAWGVSFASWEELSKPYRAPVPAPAGMRGDMADFVTVFATRYFATVRDTLKAHDPNHLYLGCRFAPFAPEVAQAAAKACDVVSFNIYATELDPAKWAMTDTLGAPCLVSEFHFGALDRGMFHPGLVRATSQQDRAAKYAGYVRSVLARPAFVGAHWFQYDDEPLTGRYWDGENFNIGFVDVTDTPYPEMVAAARSVHAQAYTLHAAAKAASTEGRR